MYIYTYICLYILHLNSILIVLWELDIFQSILGVFLKAILYIKRFMDLLCLKKGSPVAEPLGWGSWKWWFTNGALTHQEERNKGKTLTRLFWPHKSVSWEERLPAAQSPHVALAERCISSLARTARLSRRIKIPELKSTWGKIKLTNQNETEV